MAIEEAIEALWSGGVDETHRRFKVGPLVEIRCNPKGHRLAVVMASKHGPLYLPVVTQASPWTTAGEKRRGFRDPWIIPADWYVNQNGDAVPTGVMEAELLSHWLVVKDLMVHDPRDEVLHCRCGRHRRPNLGVLLDEAVAAKSAGRMRRVFVHRIQDAEASGTVLPTQANKVPEL